MLKPRDNKEEWKISADILNACLAKGEKPFTAQELKQLYQSRETMTQEEFAEAIRALAENKSNIKKAELVTAIDAAQSTVPKPHLTFAEAGKGEGGLGDLGKGGKGKPR